MKAQIDGNEYTIEFAYYTSTADAGHAHDAEITVCIIRDGSAPREPKTLAPRLASGEAVRYFRDSPNREIGRKAALEKALDALLGGPNLEGMRACATTPIKAVRRAFWNAYLGRKKKATNALPEYLEKVRKHDAGYCGVD